MSRLILSFVFVICLSGSRSQQLDTSPNLVQDLTNLVYALQNLPTIRHAQNPAYNAGAPPASSPMNYFTSSFQTPPPSVQQPVVTDLLKLLGFLPSHSHVPYHTSPQTINSIPLQFPAANPITSSFQAPASSLNDLPGVLNLLAHLSSHIRTHQSYHTMPPPIITVPQFPSQAPPNTQDSNASLLNTLLSVLSSRNSIFHSPRPAKAITVPQLPPQAPTSTHETNASLLNTLLSVLSSRNSIFQSPRPAKAITVPQLPPQAPTSTHENDASLLNTLLSVLSSRNSTINRPSNTASVTMSPPVQIVTTTPKPIEIITTEAPKARVVNSTCLNCMCEQITSCINTPGCTNPHCGVYSISKPYWVDGGQNVLPGDDKEEHQSFLNCVNDRDCADKTVEGYMARYGSDCHKDGVIDCFDFLQLHRGGLHCTYQLTSVEVETLDECLLKSN